MVRVQVGDEQAVEPGGRKGFDAVLAGGGRRPAHDPRTRVNQVGAAARHDGQRRARAVGVGVGGSRAEDDEAGGGFRIAVSFLRRGGSGERCGQGGHKESRGDFGLH